MRSNQPPQREAKKPGRTRKWLWAGVISLTVGGVLGVILWKRHFHDYTPAAAAQDLRAAYQARHAPEPINQFLELRYGPQTDPANRAAAVIDFFNAGHIEGLYLIAGNPTSQRTRTRVGVVAKILQDYRRNMTPEERKVLSDHFNSATGRAQVQSATASYQSKDARFRAATAPVIAELMTTLAAVQNH
jgi:hypothetical protein